MVDAAQLFLTTFDQLYLACRAYEAIPTKEDGLAETPRIEKTILSLGAEIENILQKNIEAPHGLPPKIASEIQYALAALIDELLIHQIAWPGRDNWFQHLIERQLFRTAVAGRRVFQNIDSLQERYYGNPHLKSMAHLYLMLLHLGFCGELRATPGKIRSYQAYLIELAEIPKQDPDRARGISEPVFPQAYQYTIRNPQPKKLSSMRHWWARLLLALLCYLIVTTVWWYAVLWQWQSDIGVPSGIGPTIEHLKEDFQGVKRGGLS